MLLTVCINVCIDDTCINFAIIVIILCIFLVPTSTVSNISFDIDETYGTLTASWPSVDDAVGYVVIFFNDSFKYEENVQTTNVVLDLVYRGYLYNVSVYAYSDILSLGLNTSVDFTGELHIIYCVIHVYCTDVFQATSFTAAAISSQSINLSWVSALSDLVESYEISYNDPCTNILMTSGIIDADKSNYTFNSLDANITYEFSLFAYNNVSNSSAPTATATTNAGGT